MEIFKRPVWQSKPINEVKLTPNVEARIKAAKLNPLNQIKK